MVITSSIQAATELWNGTNWTEVNDLNTARSTVGMHAVSTAALAFGGSPAIAITELWNGTNWTEVNDLNLQDSFRRCWNFIQQL